MANVELGEIVKALCVSPEIVQIRQEEFSLSSSLRTNLYFDVADIIISHPQAKEVIVKALIQKFLEQGVNPDRIVGVPQGMDPIVSSIADKLRVGQLRIRATAKDYAKYSLVEGDFEQGQTVAIFEDVVTTGRSVATKVCLPLKDVLLNPVSVTCLLDREMGGMERLRGLRISAFTTIREVMPLIFQQRDFEDWQVQLATQELATLG